MKTLDEIEPRTPVDPTAQGPILISEPGVYYLTGPLTGTNDLRIESGHVTLDLGGFAHTPSGPINIQVNDPAKLVTISNGTLLGSGLVEISGEGPVRLTNLHFEGEGNGEALNANGQAVISLEDSTIQNLETLAFNWDPGATLEVSRCHFEKIRSYVWPERSRVVNTEIVTGSMTNLFEIRPAARFEDVTVLSNTESQFYGKITVGSGVSIEDCRFINQPEGLNVEGGRVTIRNSALEFNTDSGQGSSGIKNAPGHPDESVLLEDVLISGYFEALSSGYFQTKGLVMRDCEIAFNYVEGMEASNANINARDLGGVVTAILSDSSFQAGHEGLSAEHADISRCRFSSGFSDIPAVIGLRIEGGNPGSSIVRDSSFSGFLNGLESLQPVELSGSSFSDCESAVDINAARSVIRGNTVIACGRGIQAGVAAVVTENTVSVRDLGISGSGLVVKNMVMTEGGGTAYNLGQGTIGRQLRGAAINPDSQRSGEPWANIWEGM